MNRWSIHVEFHQNIKADPFLNQPQHPVFPIKPCNSKARDISSIEISISFSRSRVLLSCFWACRWRAKRSALTKVSCSILCIQSLSTSEASTLKFRSSTKWKKWRILVSKPKMKRLMNLKMFLLLSKFRMDFVWKFPNFCLCKVKGYTVSSSWSLGGSRRQPCESKTHQNWTMIVLSWTIKLSINHTWDATSIKHPVLTSAFLVWR